jgi:hypothetical protein
MDEHLMPSGVPVDLTRLPFAAGSMWTGTAFEQSRPAADASREVNGAVVT